MEISCAVFYCYPWPVRFYHIFFFTLFQQRDDFKKKIENKKCFDFFYNFLSEIFPILRRIHRDIIKMYIGSHVKYSYYC